MKVLFVSWAGGGNSTPVLGLATRLAARDHEVLVVSPDDETARFSAVDLDYAVFERAPGAVRTAIETSSPDVVIVDFMMPMWLSEAESAGRPFVALVHTLYDRVAAGLLTAFVTLDAINEARIPLGLDAVGDAEEVLRRADRVLVTAPRDLDTAANVPDRVDHVGAVLEEEGEDASWTPPVGDGRLVVVSLGTTYGLDEGPVLDRVLDALSTLPVRVVVNVGPHLDTSGMSIPANAVISPYVRHAAVMPHAWLMVNHAGLGSILAALVHGVPMVSIPLDRDQPHNASRVAALGIGEALTRSASVEDIRAAIEQVMDEPRYRVAAERFADEYDPTASAAITAIESLADV